MGCPRFHGNSSLPYAHNQILQLHTKSHAHTVARRPSMTRPQVCMSDFASLIPSKFSPQIRQSTPHHDPLCRSSAATFYCQELNLLIANCVIKVIKFHKTKHLRISCMNCHPIMRYIRTRTCTSMVDICSKPNWYR